MKPLIVDTSIWIDWLRGAGRDVRERTRDRILIMPAVVALELFSGARDRKSARVVYGLVQSFDRHRRLLVASKEDYFSAGEALADLGWSATRKTNDALVVACARRVGATVLMRDLSDFGPLAKIFSVGLES